MSTKNESNYGTFTALNTKGEHISGTVCSGLIFKNATIRY